MGVNSIMDIGRLALFASQNALEVTSNNIANVNTPGYARRSLVVEENISIDACPGQMGTGVLSKEIIRHFDQWIEDSYNDKSTMAQRWETLYDDLRLVESQFNESSGFGVSSSMSKFFQDWEDLTQRADDFATREALIGDSKTLLNTIHQIDTDLVKMQQQTDDFIQQDVDRVNQILEDIAEVNKQIQIHEVPGTNNANQLRDQRDSLVRELSELVDVNYIDNGGGDVFISTQSGYALVDGQNYYSLAYEAAQSTQNLVNTSTFDGYVHFDGSDEYEYTIETVRGGVVSNASTSNVAMFKVSLDGGNTWLKDENGQIRTFYARPEDSKVTVENVKIWFGSTKDSQSSAPTSELSAGDEFNIVPKTGLYWYQNTSSKVNITPQTFFNGEDNERRLTGGKLAGYFNFRDEYVGKYKMKMDTLAQGIIWETNRQHSQGAGLTAHTLVQGTYGVEGDSFALADDSSGLTFGDRLTSGSAMMYMYNQNDGTLAASGALDFSSNAGQQNFDPNSHSLEDVRDAWNRTFGTYLNATIVNHKLQITANEGYEFQFGADTSGLNAALGLNTFFQGTSARDIELNPTVREDTDFICAGHVNGAGEVNAGDNTIALAIAGLRDTEVQLTSPIDGTTDQTLMEYYSSLVGTVGSDTATTKFNMDYQAALAQDLDERQQEIAGVNLDEEMANLIKYQHSYTAAAKLVTTADQMMQTILGMKQ